MAKKKIETPEEELELSASELEHALKAELTGTDTGKYDAPVPEIKKAVEKVGYEGDEDPTKLKVDKTPPPTLKAPWVEDEEEKKPLKEEPKAEDPYKKRYEDSVKWNTRLSQDVAEMKRVMEALRSEVTKPKEPERPQYTREQLQEWRDRDPDAFYQWQAEQVADRRAQVIEKQTQAIQAQLAGIVARSEYDRFSKEHPDTEELREEMRQELLSMPAQLTEDPRYYYQALNYAYGAVKARKFVEDTGKAKEEGRREAERRSELKKDMHVEGLGKTTTETGIDLKKASSKEIFKFMQSKGLA